MIRWNIEKTVEFHSKKTHKQQKRYFGAINVLNIGYTWLCQIVTKIWTIHWFNTYYHWYQQALNWKGQEKQKCSITSKQGAELVTLCLLWFSTGENGFKIKRLLRPTIKMVWFICHSKEKDQENKLRNSWQNWEVRRSKRPVETSCPLAVLYPCPFCHPCHDAHPYPSLLGT